MTNTRIDHTGHNHPNTTAARQGCRKAYREDIMKAQRAFMDAADQNDSELIREYEAIVDLFAMRWNMDLDAAYKLIENGPVVTKYFP